MPPTDDFVWLLAKVPDSARCLESMPDDDVAYSYIVYQWLKPVLAQLGIELVEAGAPGDDPSPLECFTAELEEG